MRLRAKKPPESRRRRPTDNILPKSGNFAYRSSRAEQELNIGRNTARDVPAGSSRNLKSFVLRRFGLIILLIVLIVSVLNALSLSSDVKVVPLTSVTSGSFLHNQTEYRAAAEEMLRSSPWNRNKITVNTGQIDAEMLRKYPELSSVSITLPLLSKRPIMYVQTSQPALALATSSGLYLVDVSGKALTQLSSTQAANQLKLPLVTDQSSLGVQLGRPALSSDNVSFIRTVIAQLAAKKFTVSSVVLPSGASELDVHLNGQPYLIKFNLQGGAGDARQQAGTFLATQAQLQSKNVTPSQYIDVRINGRAYYK